MVGRELGPYTIDRLVGHGALAWVFAAHRLATGDPLALKVLKPAYAGDRQVADRFQTDARAASRLQHPNLVAILDVGRNGRYTYFAMPLYRESLASRLATAGELDERTAIRIARDVADGLAFAHDAGLVHRDIKPANILLAPDGAGIVADLGIGHAASDYVSGTGEDMTVGTPQYISPEQAQGRRLDGRSDLYALGMSLYRATTGELPFAAIDWYELARMHVEASPAPPRTKRATLSAPFDRMVMRCLAKHPDDRYRSAADLREALDRLGRDGPESATR
ncbi:MAG: serine/threonine protein kinase [Gemmatimonadota bacterium]|nr:serine/threonine protein kinase [Gemmatimonadota bacterium]MDH3368368.1 serine/threonine protein kinase [Gemmatimonadota bacterium]MDH3478342.1 serine/threonine protein kinase [Gemmatimonadota bacterium]MDH3571343.1 serine/threonine protein kinase [Gemmatimonadota bacterium]